jgi:hypothetical protein
VACAEHESLQGLSNVAAVVKSKPMHEAAEADMLHPQHNNARQRQYLARLLRKVIRLLSVQCTKIIKETRPTRYVPLRLSTCTSVL